MKQPSIVIGLVLLIFASALIPAQAAGPPQQREAEAPYQMPAVGAHIRASGAPGIWAYYFDCEKQRGCAVFELKRRDRFASFEIHDTTGLPAYARVVTLGGEIVGEFCGKTSEPIDVRGMGLALIHILPGTCHPELMSSTPTTGVVKATFSNRL